MNHIEDNKKPSIATMVRAPILRLEQSAIVRAVRGGLVSMIPVLLIGAFSLTLKTFPVEGYQKAISVFAGGFIPQLLELVYSATFGVLSVYMTFFISRSYVKLRAEPETVHGGACAASMMYRRSLDTPEMPSSPPFFWRPFRWNYTKRTRKSYKMDNTYFK